MDKKLNTLLIDGEPMALDKLRAFIDKVDYMKTVKVCKNADEALEYMNENPVDVIFTEVSMPGKSNGIEFIESLPVRPIVVFVSAQRSYAADAFRLSAVDYLLKPYDMSDFQRAAKHIKEAYQYNHSVAGQAADMQNSCGFLFISNDGGYEKVKLSDIVYISGDAEYLALHISGREETLRGKSSFATIRPLLSPSFVQIHRSSIVNMDHVKRVTRSNVVMDDDTTLRISLGYHAAFFAQVAKLTVSNRRPEDME